MFVLYKNLKKKSQFDFRQKLFEFDNFVRQNILSDNVNYSDVEVKIQSSVIIGNKESKMNFQKIRLPQKRNLVYFYENIYKSILTILSGKQKSSLLDFQYNFDPETKVLSFYYTYIQGIVTKDQEQEERIKELGLRYNNFNINKEKTNYAKVKFSYEFTPFITKKYLKSSRNIEIFNDFNVIPLTKKIKKIAGIFEYLGRNLYKLKDVDSKIWIKKELINPKTGKKEEYLVAYYDEDDYIIKQAENIIKQKNDNINKKSHINSLEAISQLKIGSKVITEDGEGVIIDIDRVSNKAKVHLSSKLLSLRDRIKEYDLIKIAADNNSPELAPGVSSKSLSMDVSGDKQNASITIDFSDIILAQEFFNKLPIIIFEDINKEQEKDKEKEEEDKEKEEKDNKKEDNKEEKDNEESLENIELEPLDFNMFNQLQPPQGNQQSQNIVLPTGQVSQFPFITTKSSSRIKPSILKQGSQYYGILYKYANDLFYINEKGNYVFVPNNLKPLQSIYRPDNNEIMKIAKIVEIDDIGPTAFKFAIKKAREYSSNVLVGSNSLNNEYYIISSNNDYKEIIYKDTFYVFYNSLKGLLNWIQDNGYANEREFELKYNVDIRNLVGKWFYYYNNKIYEVNDYDLIKLLNDIVKKSIEMDDVLSDSIKDSILDNVKEFISKPVFSAKKLSKSPPGWEKAIERMKEKKIEEKTGISPFAIAWSLYNKGIVPGKKKHKKKSDIYIESKIKNIKLAQDFLPPFSWTTGEPKQNQFNLFSPQNLQNQKNSPNLIAPPSNDVVYDSEKDRTLFQTIVDPKEYSVYVKFINPEEEKFKNFMDNLSNAGKPDFNVLDNLQNQENQENDKEDNNKQDNNKELEYKKKIEF